MSVGRSTSPISENGIRKLASESKRQVQLSMGDPKVYFWAVSTNRKHVGHADAAEVQRMQKSGAAVTDEPIELARNSL